MTMARLPAGFALAGILVLASGIFPGNGQLLLETNPVTGCLELPGGKLLPSPLLDAYKFLANLQPVRIVAWHKDTNMSIASDGKGYAVLVETNCSDPRQLWLRDSFSPQYLNLTAGPSLSPSGGDGKPFALVSLSSIIDAKELQAMEQLEGRGVYPNIKLARYSPISVPQSMLWTQDTKLFKGGYIIRRFKEPQRILDCRVSNPEPKYAHTVLENYYEKGYYIWRIQGFLSNN